MTKKEVKNCKIGDIVICNTSFEGYPQKGWMGKIIGFKEGGIFVEWEKPFCFGHNAQGLGKEDCCRFYLASLSLIDLYKPEQLEFEF